MTGKNESREKKSRVGTLREDGLGQFDAAVVLEALDALREMRIILEDLPDLAAMALQVPKNSIAIPRVAGRPDEHSQVRQDKVAAMMMVLAHSSSPRFFISQKFNYLKADYQSLS